jgi:acid phosphatase (class A)
MLNLAQILPAPPRDGSAQSIQELEEILLFQKTRTREMIIYAQDDCEKSVFRFATVFGLSFNEKNLPATAAFFKKTMKTGSGMISPVKDSWKRTRPYKADKRVIPCLKLPSGYSYPSDHASTGRLIAIILARMIPEKREEIMKRSREFAENRVIGGVHYRSDIEAGMDAAGKIADALFTRDDFLRDYQLSRKEIRLLLGLPVDDTRGYHKEDKKRTTSEKPAA